MLSKTEIGHTHVDYIGIDIDLCHSLDHLHHKKQIKFFMIESIYRKLYRHRHVLASQFRPFTSQKIKFFFEKFAK